MTLQPQTNLYSLYLNPTDGWFIVVNSTLRAWTSKQITDSSFNGLHKISWLFTNAHKRQCTFICQFNSLPHLQSLMPELFI